MKTRLITICLALCAMVLQSTQAAALPDGIKAEALVNNLTFPIAMAPADNGDILVTEKFGTIRLVRDGELVEEPVASVEVLEKNEAGLLGVALFPDYETSGEFVVSYTPKKDLEAIYVSKFKMEDTTATMVDETWIKFPSRPETDRHYGGNMRFENGYFYISLSDLLTYDSAADLDRPAGSILRYNEDATIPEDNPFGADNPIYAYGLRNTFDFDVDADGVIWGGDNGQDLHDEVNRIEPGGFYGWPFILGKCDNYPLLESCDGVDDYVEPVFEFPFNVGPTGALIYEGSLMPEMQGDIFISGWHSGEVHHFVPTDGGVEEQDVFFVMPGGAIFYDDGDNTTHLGDKGVVDVDEGTDGSILVMVSSYSGGDIIRIAPEAELLNPSQVVENGPLNRGVVFPDTDACAISDVGGDRAPAPLGLGLMLAVLGGVLCVRRRRRLGPWTAALAVSVAMLIGQAAPAAALPGDVSVGGKVGADLTRVNGHNAYLQTWTVGPSVGGSLRYEPLRFLGVNLDALYALKGAGINFRDGRLKMHYLNVPLTAQLKAPWSDWIKPRLFGGVSGSFLITSRVVDTDNTDQLRRFDYGLLAGLGADVPLAIGDITVDIWFERGVRVLLDEDAAPEGTPTGENRSQAFFATVGFLF